MLQPFLDFQKKSYCQLRSWKQYAFFASLAKRVHKSGMDTEYNDRDGAPLLTVYFDDDHFNTHNYIVIELSKRGGQFGSMDVIIGKEFSN